MQTESQLRKSDRVGGGKIRAFMQESKDSQPEYFWRI
jgi:hypothetical protein